MSEILEPLNPGGFGGLRLDLPVDEVGPDEAIFLRDVDWDGSTGKIRSRDGFQKLKETEASGEYKALFPHSSLRLLATLRYEEEEESKLKLVAIDREGAEKTEATLKATAAKSTFARFGTPTASYTYMRTNTAEQKVVRFDGSAFSEPTATVGGEASKEMPKAALMVAWPDAGNRMVYANTGSEGGPNKLSSSASHVWFSEPGTAEKFETTAFVQLSVGDGEEITAMAVYDGKLFVFKETRFFVFYTGTTVDEEGKPVFHFREVTLGDGSRMKRASAETMAETSDQIATSSPVGVYFCTTDGVYVTGGGQPSKISEALKPLEETVPFDGPMADFLNGSTESFRWPAQGIVSLGQRIYVKRYEYLFVYDIPTDSWTCWKMPNVSLAVWTGLTGGGSDGSEKTAGTVESVSPGTTNWSDPNNAKVVDGTNATATVAIGEPALKRLQVTNFGFAIPEAATIRGIKVSLTRRAGVVGAAAVTGTIFRVVKAGTEAGSQYTDEENWPISDKTISVGGPEDLWGTTWTPAQINASNFGAIMSPLREYTGESIISLFVDALVITVYYSVAEASGGVRPRLFATQSKHVFWTGPAADEDAATRDPGWQSGFANYGLDDEKSIRDTKVWGKGTVAYGMARDYGDIEPTSEATLEFGEPATAAQKRTEKQITGTLISHRLSGTAPWSVQRLVHYMPPSRVPTTKST